MTRRPRLHVLYQLQRRNWLGASWGDLASSWVYGKMAIWKEWQNDKNKMTRKWQDAFSLFHLLSPSSCMMLYDVVWCCMMLYNVVWCCMMLYVCVIQKEVMYTTYHLSMILKDRKETTFSRCSKQLGQSTQANIARDPEMNSCSLGTRSNVTKKGPQVSRTRRIIQDNSSPKTRTL